MSRVELEWIAGYDWPPDKHGNPSPEPVPRMTRAVYNTVEEAFTQGAHDLSVTGRIATRILIDGEEAYGPRLLQNAADVWLDHVKRRPEHDPVQHLPPDHDAAVRDIKAVVNRA